MEERGKCLEDKRENDPARLPVLPKGMMMNIQPRRFYRLAWRLTLPLALPTAGCGTDASRMPGGRNQSGLLVGEDVAFVSYDFTARAETREILRVEPDDFSRTSKTSLPGRKNFELPDTRPPGSFKQDQHAKVFEQDDRIRVTDTTAKPWSAIGAVMSFFPDGHVYQGTGAMIGPAHFLTVAHLLYHEKRGGWPTSVMFFPGLDGEAAPFGVISVKRIHIPEAWMITSFVGDLAIVELDEPMGEQAGWFDVMAHSGSYLLEQQVHVAGRAGDPRREFDNPFMWYTHGPNIGVDGGMLHSRLDWAGGQSGSPMWERIGSERRGVGVVSRSNDFLNSATRLHSTYVRWIKVTVDSDGL